MKDKGGRPTVITPEVIKRLEEGFVYGLTDAECCLFAEISQNSLYRYIEKNPKFGKRKDLLKHSPKIKAKFNVCDKINDKDLETSKWYLERKAKDEFSTRNETKNETTINDLNIKEENKELDELIKKTGL